MPQKLQLRKKPRSSEGADDGSRDVGVTFHLIGQGVRRDDHLKHRDDHLNWNDQRGDRHLNDDLRSYLQRPEQPMGCHLALVRQRVNLVQARQGIVTNCPHQLNKALQVKSLCIDQINFNFSLTNEIFRSAGCVFYS